MRIKRTTAEQPVKAPTDAEREAASRDVPPGIELASDDEIRAQLAQQLPPVHLYAAIHKAQAKIETVRKNGENPHYKSRYATLDEIWESVRKAINEAGLIVVCIPDIEAKSLTTYIIHAATGEEIHASFPVTMAGVGPQAVGSAMTYARRYTLTAMLQIVTGDGSDDDGEAASVPHNNNQKSAAAVAEALGF